MMNDQNQGAMTNLKSFDSVPIGKKIKFQIPEYAQNQLPAMMPEHNNPQPKPLAERLKKNIVKVKKDALDQLLAIVKNNPYQFQPYSHMATDFLSFNDPNIQDRGLKIVYLYLQGGSTLKADAKAMIKVLIEKCLCVQKQEIKFNSEQILYWYMDNSHEDLLINELKDYIAHKNRKIVATVLIFIANLLHNYGIKRLKSLEIFSKNLQILAAPPKPTAKNQSIYLFKEVYKWMGEASLKEFKMHPEVKDEIVKFGKEYQKVPMEIIRGIKKQHLKQGERHRPVYYMQQEQNQNQEPMDVLSGYTSQWVDHVLKIQKWKQKKQQLEQFIKKTKIPNILPARQTSHFIFLIKKLLSDNNINIFYCGLFIIQNLSKGLKKQFSHIAKNIISQVFNKLKDSKPMTVQLTQTTLVSLLHSLVLQDFMQDIRDGLNDKSPLMKQQVLKFLNNFYSKKDPKISNLIRTLLDKIIQLTEDGAAKVRAQSLESLCTMKIAHGLKFFGQKIKKLDPKKLQTLQLAKAVQNNQIMQIEQSVNTVNVSSNVPIPVLQKQSNTVKIKLTTSQQFDNPHFKQSHSVKIPAKSQQTSSVNSNGDHKVARSLNLNCLQQISSSSQAVRANGYQQIANKFLSKDIKQFIGQIKTNSIKQSSPLILKLIIQIAKKYINNTVADLQITEYVLKHDWKRSKQLYQQFIQSNRFTTEAQQAVRINSIPNSTGKSQAHSLQVSTHTIKTFSIELQNSLITKMSSPIDSIKKQAAEYAISIWQSIPKISSEAELTPSNGWHEQHMSKFFNIIRYRLSQSNQQIISLYCKLIIQMINKGITVKNKLMKSVIQIVYSNLNRGYIEIKQLFKEMVSNAPNYMFLSMQSEICADTNRDAIIQFIVENSELFFKCADLKAFMNPFLHILCTTNTEIKLKQALDSLFNQMIQIQGQSVLERQISKLKVSNIQVYNQYLAKYNICLNKNNYHQSNPGKNYILRQDRIKYWQEEQWHLKITSNHILKLANMMNSLGQPFNSLCNLFYLTYENILTLNKLQYNFIVEYSDIFFKFIYWRTNVDSNQMMEEILKFASRLIVSTSYSITEIDMILFLKSIINVIDRFKGTYINQISEMLKKSFKINLEIQNNTFQFLINFLMDNSPNQSLADQILQLFTKCYEQRIQENLVQLARIPSVHKNQNFIKFIESKFDHQHLSASGFRVAVINKPQNEVTQTKILLSSLGGPQNIYHVQPHEARIFIEMFQQNSNYLQERLTQLTYNIDFGVKIEIYVKILYCIVNPYFKKQISNINIFTFLSKIPKVIAESSKTKRTYLKDLTRILMYFLIDLDQSPPLGVKQPELTKQVNKCILTLIEQSDLRHMFQVLFLLQRRHLQLNITPKIIHLIIKCIGRATRTKGFYIKLNDNLAYVLQQTNNILTQFDIKVQSTIIKSYKSIFIQLFKFYPQSTPIYQSQIRKKQVHPGLTYIHDQYTKPAQPGNSNSQHPLKEQIKESGNIIKSMGTVGINKLASIKKGQTNENL